MKLFTVFTINRATKRQNPPRYGLAPMNHAAACNFARACTTEATRCYIHPWPADVPHPKPPMIANYAKP